MATPHITPAPLVAGFTIQLTAPGDIAAISALHARTFGPGRFARTAYRIREAKDRLPISPHCRIARDHAGQLAGAVTMTAISVGSVPGHWLLGPLAIRPELAGQSLGRSLVRAALSSITDTGNDDATVILVGDLKYYGTLGFAALPTKSVILPGPVDPARVLAWLGPNGNRTPPRGEIRAD